MTDCLLRTFAKPSMVVVDAHNDIITASAPSSAQPNLLEKTVNKLQWEYETLQRLLNGRAPRVGDHRSSHSATEDTSAATTSHEQWTHFSTAILTSTRDDDPLFDLIGKVAFFCQLRAGEGEYDTDQGEGVLAAVEDLREELDERCRRLRTYVDVCDANLVAAVANGRSGNMPTNSADPQRYDLDEDVAVEEAEETEEKTIARLEGLSNSHPSRGNKLMNNKRQAPPKRGGNTSNLNGNNARGGARPSAASSDKSPSSHLPALASLHPLYPLSQRYKKLRTDCLCLLKADKSQSLLFVVFEAIANYCCAMGHTLDTVCIVSQEVAIEAGMEAANRGVPAVIMPGRGGGGNDAMDKSERAIGKYNSDGDVLLNANTTTESHVVRLGNGMLATVMVEVSLSDMDVETEARRTREVQDVVRSLQELAELQELMAVETQRQGVDLAQSDVTVEKSYSFAVAARQHLMKAAKHKLLYVTIAGGIVGAALGGPVGLAIGAKSAAAIVGASAVGGVTTAVATNVATKIGAVTVDEDYEEGMAEAKEARAAQRRS